MFWNIKINKYFCQKLHSNWSEEAFVIKNVKNNAPWKYFINDLKEDEIVGTFYEK